MKNGEGLSSVNTYHMKWRSVDETEGSVDVCAEIVDLPGELQTVLIVTLSASDGVKAGL